jgi:hypothetical protein
MGYGFTGGAGYIWISMPTVGGSPLSNQTLWWGNIASTEDYCLKTVLNVCQNYGGDPSAVILIGFGRGGIACNYVGMYDSTIADTWLAFISDSAYDGQYTNWGYPYADDSSALARLQRLQGRLQHISVCQYEVSPQSYLQGTGVSMAPFTFRTLPFESYSMAWTERPVQLRRDVRAWLNQVVTNRPATFSISGQVTNMSGVPVQNAYILSGVTHFTYSDANGNYVLPGLTNSSRTVTATLAPYAFPNQSVIVSGSNVQNINFQSTQ